MMVRWTPAAVRKLQKPPRISLAGTAREQLSLWLWEAWRSAPRQRGTTRTTDDIGASSHIHPFQICGVAVV